MSHLNTLGSKTLQVKNVDSIFAVQLKVKKSFTFGVLPMVLN